MTTTIDFRDHSVGELAVMVRAKQLSATELVATALDRIASADRDLHAFVAVDAETAVRDASDIDRRIAAGERVGPLAGIPLAVKDMENAAGYRTCAGSRALLGNPPAPTDSTLVARLRAAGCIVVGKTNTPEFGLKPTTDNSAFGISRNPWNADFSPGGSSGGSAAAVAAGMVPLATASDGGGSIRIPSALCGLPGMKPSLGHVPSADADPPGWPNISTKGVLAARAADVRLALNVVRGPSAFDLRSLPATDGPWTEGEAARRALWCPTLGYAEVDREVIEACLAAVSALAADGVEVVEVERVFTEDPGPTLGTLVGAYTRRAAERFRGTPDWQLLDPAVVLTSELSRLTVDGLAIVKAIDACHRLNVQLVAAMTGYDILLCPTTAGQTPTADMTAPVSQVIASLRAQPELLGDLPADVADQLFATLAGFDSINLPYGTINGSPAIDWSRMTQPFNLTGSPAATAWAGCTSRGMPVGLQIVGSRLADAAVLATLERLERLHPPSRPT